MLWEARERIEREFAEQQAAEAARKEAAEKRGREEAEARAAALEARLQAAQGTLTEVAEEAARQQAQEGHDTTIYLACSNGDLALGIGTLEQMRSESVAPSASALGSLIEAHVKDGPGPPGAVKRP